MKKNLILLLLTALSSMLAAQVTIGSDKAPVTGSLLQLKETESTTNNSARGLAIPRVKLTNKTALYPMFETVAGNAIPTNDYNNDSKKAAQDAQHTGLVVYSTSQCELNGEGMYVWDGEVWQSLSALGVGVIEHPAKAGVYEEFTSASFGAAGRWMTTNLSAMAYDGNKHSTDLLDTATEGWGSPRTLTGPNGGPQQGGQFNTAYWAYPNTGPNGSMDATEYSKNKALGYLYTWDAATAGKGGELGETCFPGEAGTNHANSQGICPAGWHLPSDYEWTLLENELQSYTSTYSSTDNIGGTVAAPGYSSTAAIGIPMKSACKTTATAPDDTQKGTSKSVSQGGFSALFAGYAESDNTSSFGFYGYYWSSSSDYTDNIVSAWYRAVGINLNALYRYSYSRNIMNSVRCKKD